MCTVHPVFQTNPNIITDSTHRTKCIERYRCVHACIQGRIHECGDNVEMCTHHESIYYVVHCGARLWCYRRNSATITEHAVSQPSCTLSVPFLHASERNLSGRLGSWKLMSENGNWLSKNNVPTYATIFKRHVPLTTCNQSPTRPESKKHGGFNMSQGISSHFKPFLLLDFGVKLRCSSIWISWASRHWQSLQRSPPNRAPEVNASRDLEGWKLKVTFFLP